MSEEQLKAFLEKVQIDTDLQNQCKGAASFKETVDIAKAAGFSITEDDMKSIATMQSLSDDELEALAGGSHMHTCTHALGSDAQCGRVSSLCRWNSHSSNPMPPKGVMIASLA
ncbi:Nif11-like leader peptide family natural product precursor [Synechococcus sp. A15-60]|uniref:Nif11-like leader peptide family natural product precursor n=1 Tax=Synechococcus sp. A15-60 TaxID=1050655 RepID=UPI00164745F9|nr:Nif11-like leader peptide family natural product precursor [Synechococcus sp. A15-60]